MGELKGIEKLKEAVQRNCNERNSCGCFNPNGCNVKNSQIGAYGTEGFKSCFHAYCDKFKWVTDRAAHYAEKTGIPAEEIINAWESRRDYWYMNYYQDCNQPEIKGDRVKVFETVDEFLKSIGDKKFRCPSCGGVSSSPYKCDSGQEMNKGKICNWNVGGLFGDLGKGIYVFFKDKVGGETIFMPIAWEDPIIHISNICAVNWGGKFYEVAYKIGDDGPTHSKNIPLEFLKQKGVTQRLNGFKKLRSWLESKDGQAYLRGDKNQCENC